MDIQQPTDEQLMDEQLMDEQLMELVNAGGEVGREAFGELYLRHNEALTIFLLTRRHLSVLDIEDIVQQVWTNLFEVGRCSFDPARGPFRPWLCAVGTNLYRNFYRDKHRLQRGGKILHHHLHMIPKGEGGEPVVDKRTGKTSCPHPVEEAIVQERRAVVRDNIQRLPTKNRQAMEAIWLDEKTFRGFAQESNIPKRTLEYRCKRARDMMSRSLSQV